MPSILLPRPSEHSVDKYNSQAHCSAQNHSQMVPPVGVGENYFRWGQLEYFKHWQCFGNMYCEYSQYLEVLYHGYFLYPSTSYFDAAGTYLPVLSGFRAAHTLSILRVVGSSRYSLYVGRQYVNSMLSVLGLRIILGHLLLCL